MNEHELRSVIYRCVSKRLTGVMLNAPAPRSGIHGRRIRTPFGLCEVISGDEHGRVNFFCDLPKLKKYLERLKAERRRAEENQ